MCAVYCAFIVNMRIIGGHQCTATASHSHPKSSGDNRRAARGAHAVSQSQIGRDATRLRCAAIPSRRLPELLAARRTALIDRSLGNDVHEAGANNALGICALLLRSARAAAETCRRAVQLERSLQFSGAALTVAVDACERVHCCVAIANASARGIA